MADKKSRISGHILAPCSSSRTPQLLLCCIHWLSFNERTLLHAHSFFTGLRQCRDDDRICAYMDSDRRSRVYRGMSMEGKIKILS
jgi:hypothetical protein